MTYIPTDDPADPGAPVDSERAGSRRATGCALEIVETLVLTLIIYLVIHNFVAQPFEVQQSSMMPTVLQGEYILIDKITPRLGDYERGDIVVFQPPSGHQQDGIPFIKRIVGIPGDTITLRNGRVYVQPAGASDVRLDEPYLAAQADGTPRPTLCKPTPECVESWSVRQDEYFVLGDNREVSQDSRVFGPIDADLIVGRAWLRYFPIDRLGIVDRPAYEAIQGAEGSSLRYPGGSSATIQVSTSRP